MVTFIAHRGASLFAPENTMPAFILAHNTGIKNIECDVVLTADKIPILMHDSTLSRTTNGSGLVNQSSYEYIQTLDAGSWFHPNYKGTKVSRLSELLHWQAKTNSILYIEIKPILTQNFREDLAIIMAEINKFGDSNKIKILSFQAQIFGQIALDNNQLPRVLGATYCSAQTIDTAIENGCEQINISHEICTQSLIEDIQQAGLKIGVFTVNELVQIEELISLGIDEIFTDNPTLPITAKSIIASHHTDPLSPKYQKSSPL